MCFALRKRFTMLYLKMVCIIAINMKTNYIIIKKFLWNQTIILDHYHKIIVSRKLIRQNSTYILSFLFFLSFFLKKQMNQMMQQTGLLMNAERQHPWKKDHRQTFCWNGPPECLNCCHQYCQRNIVVKKSLKEATNSISKHYEPAEQAA